MSDRLAEDTLSARHGDICHHILGTRKPIGFYNAFPSLSPCQPKGYTLLQLHSLWQNHQHSQNVACSLRAAHTGKERDHQHLSLCIEGLSV